MGITIHYKGQLNNSENRNEVVAIIEDIAKTAGWSVQNIDDEEKKLFGVILGVAEKCEPFPFLFDKNGVMRSVFWLIGVAEPDEEWIFTKTQYAGIETHIVIIKFLEFIKNKYVSNLEVHDETEYWKHRDTNILEQKFKQMNFILNAFSNVLSNIEFDRDNETLDDLVIKIEQAFEIAFEKINKPASNRIANL